MWNAIFGSLILIVDSEWTEFICTEFELSFVLTTWMFVQFDHVSADLHATSAGLVVRDIQGSSCKQREGSHRDVERGSRCVSRPFVLPKLC